MVANEIEPMIPKNSTIPIEVSKTFISIWNFQENVNFSIYETEKPYLKGKLVMLGLN